MLVFYWEKNSVPGANRSSTSSANLKKFLLQYRHSFWCCASETVYIHKRRLRTCNSDQFVTVYNIRVILIIKTTRCNNFSNLFLE